MPRSAIRSSFSRSSFRSSACTVVPANLPTTALRVGASLPWDGGSPRDAQIVVLSSPLGWLCDAMDQNLFNQLGIRSWRNILGPDFLHAGPKGLEVAVSAWGGTLPAIFLIGW